MIDIRHTFFLPWCTQLRKESILSALKLLPRRFLPQKFMHPVAVHGLEAEVLKLADHDLAPQDVRARVLLLLLRIQGLSHFAARRRRARGQLQRAV